MEALMYGGLNPQERSFLNDLTRHPGYNVLERLLAEACRLATEKVVKTNPEEPNYLTLLQSRQVVARVTNDVVVTLLKSIEMHANTAKLEIAQKAEEETVQETVKPLGSKFGSFVINPDRKIGHQSNQ